MHSISRSTDADAATLLQWSREIRCFRSRAVPTTQSDRAYLYHLYSLWWTHGSSLRIRRTFPRTGVSL